MSNVPWAAIVRPVHERARHCCEYCQTCQDIMGQAMHVEHIDPNGGDDPENVCLACPTCNLSTSTATSALDPITGTTVPLFHPRRQH
jgi:5-methylcytosine-specific restriction endonuclease McrA